MMAKIMLVEDDNNLREIYEARLQAEGYTIVSAKDGEEALVVAKAEKPDLVISDVMMPKISGFEMLDILRNTDGLKEVKVIMLTALGQSDDQQRADKLGADRYLVKSQVTLEDIVKVTHDLLEGEPTAVATAAAPQPTTTPTATPPAEPAPVVDTPLVPVATAPPPETAASVTPVAAAPAEERKTEKAAEPEPTTALEPSIEPVNEPAATTDTSAAPTKPDVAVEATAPTAAAEEASVEAKIEDFVAGATTEPTTPSAPADATPAPPAEPLNPAADSEPTAQTDNDRLTSEAVDALIANTENKSDSSEPIIQPEPKLPVEPVTETEVTQQPPTDVNSVPEPEPKPAEEVASTGSTSHNKVIEPIDSQPKKDLDVLLAQEEAKEASAGTATPAAAVVVSDGDKPVEPEPAPPKDPTKPDPNDIAL